MWGAMAGAPLLMAHYESHGSEGLKEAGLPMARMLMLLSFPAAAGLAAVATPLSEFMIGESLREQAALVIPWIAAAGLLNGLNTYYFVESYQLAHRTALSAMLMIIPVVVNILLNLWLIPKFGIMGAVAATLISYIISMTTLIAVSRRFAPLPFPLKDAFMVAVASIAMAVSVSYLPAWGGFIELIVKAVIGAIVYFVLIFVTNAANARELITGMRASLTQRTS
jgi:O-antigen/teichoic acid export membrane protein